MEDDHHLSRQEQGKLAERLVSGLYREPAEELIDEIEGHTRKKYPELVGNAPVSVELTELSGYD